MCNANRLLPAEMLRYMPPPTIHRKWLSTITVWIDFLFWQRVINHTYLHANLLIYFLFRCLQTGAVLSYTFVDWQHWKTTDQLHLVASAVRVRISTQLIYITCQVVTQLQATGRWLEDCKYVRKGHIAGTAKKKQKMINNWRRRPNESCN